MSRLRAVQASAVLIGAVIALAAAEVALRSFDLYRPIDHPVRPAQPDLYEADPVVGYRLRASRAVTYRYPHGSGPEIPLVSNSDGFRSPREFGEMDQRRRILVVGDSFVFGQGVRAEERLTERLEAAEPGWRVDNMGMTGWGIDLMVRAIEHLGPKADPDVVVLAVYTDDFRRLLPNYAGLGYAYPKFEFAGSALATVPFPYPRPWERLRVVQAAYDRGWRWRRNRYDLNEALLDRFLANGTAMAFRPVVAFLPGRGDTDEDQERREFLRRWATAHDVPYVDLTTPIRGAGVDRVFIAGNWHWNPAGHQLAANELRPVLAQLSAAAGRTAAPGVR